MTRIGVLIASCILSQEFFKGFMRWGKPTIPRAVMAVLAVAVFLSVADEADAGCLSLPEALLKADDSSVALFLAAAADEAGVVASLSCVNGSLERIALRAEPGQQAEIALLLANAGFDPASISSAMAGDGAWASDWVHLEVLQAEVPAGGVLPISLVLSVPNDFAPGSRHEHRFDLAGEEGETLSVTVMLEVIEEQPMFRDGFDVDPVLGQFSFRHDSGVGPGS